MKLGLLILATVIANACGRTPAIHDKEVSGLSRSELFQLKRACVELGLRERADEEKRAADERAAYSPPIVSYDEQMNTCLYTNISRGSDGSRTMFVLDLLSRDFVFGFDDALDKQQAAQKNVEFANWQTRIRQDATR